MGEAVGDPIEIPDRLNMVTWFLDDRVEQGKGDAPAIHYHPQQADQRRTVTYAQVQAGSCRVANLLRELGLSIEDRVLLLLLDTPEFVETYFGVLRAGCVAVPANTWLQPKDYAYYLEYARPKAVFVDAEVWPQVEPVFADAPYTKHFIVLDRSGGKAPAGTLDYRERVAAMADTANTEPTYRDDFATWLSSSGSTGNPKCVVHMHHDFMWNTIAYAQRTLKLTDSDITLGAPKLFFGYALASNMLFPLSVGGQCVLAPPSAVAPGLLRAGGAVPRHPARDRADRDREDAQGAGRRRLRPVDAALAGVRRGGPAPLGCTGTSRPGSAWRSTTASARPRCSTCTSPNRPGDVKEGSLGRIVDGYTYRLVDDDGNVVPKGEIGTLVIEGPSAGAVLLAECATRAARRSSATRSRAATSSTSMTTGTSGTAGAATTCSRSPGCTSLPSRWKTA